MSKHLTDKILTAADIDPVKAKCIMDMHKAMTELYGLYGSEQAILMALRGHQAELDRINERLDSLEDR